MNRPLTPTDAKLKLATRHCIAQGAGPVECAKHTRVSASHLSEYGNTEHGSFVPLDVALELDRLANEPIILRAFAEAQGFDLVEKQCKALSAASLPRAGGRLSVETADVVDTIAKIMDDGKVTPREGRVLVEQAAEVRDQLSRIEDIGHSIVAGAA